MMIVHARLATTICAMVLILAGANATPTLAQDGSPVEEIRKQLLKLPYYGVFDFSRSATTRARSR